MIHISHLRIGWSMNILKIIKREMGKQKTHSPIYNHVINKDFAYCCEQYIPKWHTNVENHCLTALSNPCLSVFVATIIPSLVTVIWIVWKSGPPCTNTGSPRYLGIWHAILIPCMNYWACVMVSMFLFYPLMKREILSTFCLNWDFHVSSSCITLVISLDIWLFYLPRFTFIHCANMCFYSFIYSHTYGIPVYVFCCALFTCKLYANKDIYFIKTIDRIHIILDIQSTEYTWQAVDIFNALKFGITMIRSHHILNSSYRNKHPAFPEYIYIHIFIYINIYIYEAADRMWWYNQLRYTATENMTTMGKVDTPDLIILIRWVTNITYPDDIFNENSYKINISLQIMSLTSSSEMSLWSFWKIIISFCITNLVIDKWKFQNITCYRM